MKLRDNAELRSQVLAMVCSVDDGLDEPGYVTGRILDAVDRALATPSPETGTAAVPTKHCDAKTCVLDVLAPVFGADAGNIAMEYTCFPMNCDVASAQARYLLEQVTLVGKETALAQVKAKIYADLAAAMANRAPAGPAPDPVKPPATCQCFHAPEQHHRETGCGVVAIMSGRCPCEWNGARTPAAGTEEGRFRCICPDKAKCPNCELSCLFCRCERRATPEKGGPNG